MPRRATKGEMTEKAKLDRARRIQTVVNTKIKTGEYVPVSDVDLICSRLAQTVAIKLRVVPQMVAGRVSVETDPAIIENVIAEKIEFALTELSKMKFSDLKISAESLISSAENLDFNEEEATIYDETGEDKSVEVKEETEKAAIFSIKKKKTKSKATKKGKTKK